MSEINLIRDSITNKLVDEMEKYSLFGGKSESLRNVIIKNGKVNIAEEVIYIKVNKPVTQLTYIAFKALKDIINDYIIDYKIKIILSDCDLNTLLVYEPSLLTNDIDPIDTINHAYITIVNDYKNKKCKYDILLNIKTAYKSRPKVTGYSIKNKDGKDILKNLIKIDELGIEVEKDLLNIFAKENNLIPLLREFKEYSQIIGSIASFYILSYDTKIEGEYLILNCKDNKISFESKISTYGFTDDESLKQSATKNYDLDFTCKSRIQENSPLNMYKFKEFSNKEYYINTNCRNETALKLNYESAENLKNYFSAAINFDYIDELAINMISELAYVCSSVDNKDLLIYNKFNNIIGVVPMKAIKSVDTFISKYLNFYKLYKNIVAIPTFKKY